MQKTGLIRKHSKKLEAICIVIDALLIVACFYVAALITDFPWNPHFSFISVLSVVLFYVFARGNKLYLSWRTSSIWSEIKYVIKSWTFVFLIVIAFALIMNLTGGYTRRVFISWFFMGLVAIVLWRFGLRLVLRYFRSRGKNRKFVAIAGAGILGTEVTSTILNNPWTGLTIYGVYDDGLPKGSIICHDVQVAGNIDDLVNVAQSGSLDYVYIALPAKAEKRIIDVVDKLSDTSVSINLIPDQLMRDFLETKTITLNGMPIINIVENPLNGKIYHYKRFQQLIKRIIDLTISLLVLTIFAPIIILFSLLILVLEGRPILYRSKRYISANEKIFTYKFRSMVKNATDPKYKLKERFMRDGFLDIPVDCEVYTPIGRILEKTQMVEILQVFNVIIDKMSLIGNRPLPFDNLVLLKKHKNWTKRFDSPAGMTGISQVVGKLNLIPEERLELEGLYSEVYENGSILKCDILIICYTIRLILLKKETSIDSAFDLLNSCLQRK